MANTKPPFKFVYEKETQTYQCIGRWSVLELDGLINQLQSKPLPKETKIAISGEKLTYFDSAGALAIHRCIHFFQSKGKEVELIHFNKQQQALLDLVEKQGKVLDYKPPPPVKKNIFYRIGKESDNKFKQMEGFVVLLGDVCTKFSEALYQWRRFQLPSIISIIDSTGIQALPILALLSFLIGIVLAYQMGLQLQTYGANTFIAYLSGMAIFREFAPLITAIIVAGRTSSAFTAQIGSMKLNEEVDAIKTLGLSPTELLVLPKVLGLLFVFPLLIFWSDVFSILGSMFMSKSMLLINYHDFLVRLKNSVGLDQFMLGIYKAPAFAFIIALVGCFQGFLVDANADSIGSQTTKSVVQALFLIIIADAVYSVIYSWMNL